MRKYSTRVTNELLESLNDQQREAACAVTGPVAILAGAGTGKTTTITRRIAWQVVSGAFTPSDILAVTFTRKAAGEMRERLASLGVRGVEARTFHAAAMWMLRYLWPTYMGSAIPELVQYKGAILNPIVQRLRPPYAFRPRRDFAQEIEWSRVRGIEPDAYEHEAARAGREPGIPADIIADVYRAYLDRKQSAGLWDFEDLLIQLIALFEAHPEALERIRTRFRSFTVDEYQDVNPLQQRLLELWLGDRDDMCVVGDDYQTIYTFAGASPHYLLSFAQEHPTARVVTLERNYRSTPKVLGLANSIAAQLGGARKQLVAAQESDGPDPVYVAHATATDEVEAICKQCSELHASGTLWHEIAVLYRTNARSTAFEAELSRRAIPFQVKGGQFLNRDAFRQLSGRIRGVAGGGGADVVARIHEATEALGYSPNAAASGDSDEATRQSDLLQARNLAAQYADSVAELATIAGFLEFARGQYASDSDGSGVQLMTLHSAKGLEFDAVFLPHLVNGELPYFTKQSRSPVIEERRLLYVGVTRARAHLSLSWYTSGKTTRSFLLDDAGAPEPPAPPAAPERSRKRTRSMATTELAEEDEPMFERLRAWRLDESRSQGVPAYRVLGDATLVQIATLRPTTTAQLGEVKGIGPEKLHKYGEDVIGVLTGE